MASNNPPAQKLLWIDLEMTGLDPQKDRIIEVAAIITDWDFKELATFESGIKHNDGVVEGLLRTNSFFALQPALQQDLLTLSESSPLENAVERQLREFIDRHFTVDEKVVLAGNSIHQDRRFIRQWWPSIEERLHYRMLDVSAWKVVMQGKYALEVEKGEAHRALEDIRESIAELQYYLDFFGKS